MVRFSKSRDVRRKGTPKAGRKHYLPVVDNDDDDTSIIDVELAEAKKRNRVKRKLYANTTVNESYKDIAQDSIGLYRTVSRCAVYIIAILILYSCKQVIDEAFGTIFPKKGPASSVNYFSTNKTDEIKLNSTTPSPSDESLAKKQENTNSTDLAMSKQEEEAPIANISNKETIVNNSSTEGITSEEVEKEDAEQTDEQDEPEVDTASDQQQPLISNFGSYHDLNLLQQNKPLLPLFPQTGSSLPQLPNLLSTLDTPNLPLSQTPLQPLSTSSGLTNPFAFQTTPMQALLTNPSYNQLSNSLQTQPLYGIQPGTLLSSLPQQIPPA